MSCQKKGAKRRLKSRGNGSILVASERAVSIPQITYDHIEDSVEKKDVSFYGEQPSGPVEGICTRNCCITLTARILVNLNSISGYNLS